MNKQKSKLNLINADYEKLLKIYETKYSIQTEELKQEIENIIQEIKTLIQSDSIEEAITMQISKFSFLNLFISWSASCSFNNNSQLPKIL